MTQANPSPVKTARAPEGFRDALTELVQVGLRVARMIGQVADAETALAEAAAQAGAAEGVSALASSLAEAIEADRAAAAAGEARQTVVARAEAIAGAFARVSRAIRLTVSLAERLDRGWARGGAPDDTHAAARRQIARGVEDALGREADRERAESLDTEDELADRPVEEVIQQICRDLGLDPVRMIVRTPLPDAAGVAEVDGTAPLAGGVGRDVPQRRPDG